MRQDLAFDLSCWVSSFITNRCWNLPPAMTVEMHELWPEVLAIPLSTGQDSITWDLDDTGFKFRSAWNAVRSHGSVKIWTGFIWCKGTVPQKAFCAWRELSYGLPTQDLLQQRGITLVSRCPLCCCASETTDHVLWSCSFASQV